MMYFWFKKKKKEKDRGNDTLTMSRCLSLMYGVKTR